jgi:hypothetical protein
MYIDPRLRAVRKRTPKPKRTHPIVAVVHEAHHLWTAFKQFT